MTSSWDILVQWRGRSAAEATWEPLESFKQAFPKFKLEEELFRHWGGGSVMDTFFGQRYRRRKVPQVQAPASG
jgi:hypothetical protein